MQANQANDDDKESCKLARLDPNEKIPPEVKCVRVPPVQDSCQIAEKIFHSKPPPKCKDQNTHTICSIVAYQQVRIRRQKLRLNFKAKFDFAPWKLMVLDLIDVFYALATHTRFNQRYADA